MDVLAVDMQGISKSFGGKYANHLIDFQVKQGSIHGLLGENGAGKTTLMNILYGLYQPDAGTIRINGREEKLSSPEAGILLGIGMVHQHFMLARPLTVAENILAGRFKKKQIGLNMDRVAADIVRLAAKYDMKVDPERPIWQLSVGEQQRVEILSALYQNATVLILDEPTAVLTPGEAQELFCTLREMARDGKSIILITHKLDEVLAVADEVTILRQGRKLKTFPVTPDLSKEQLSLEMVGDAVCDLVPRTIGELKEGVAIRLENVSVNNDRGVPALDGVTMSIQAGEIVGLAGVEGNGQKELCEILTGVKPVVSGAVLINGQSMLNRETHDFIEAGVAHIPEDRLESGLALDFSVARNFFIKAEALASVTKHGMVDLRRVRKKARSLIGQYGIQVITEDDPVRLLSGGNQQKVILARELEQKPNALIANQPTRGLDVAATCFVRQQIINAAGAGTAVLLISADLDEIRELSDRIAVIYEGKIMDILERNAPIERIAPLMLGQRAEAVS